MGGRKNNSMTNTQLQIGSINNYFKCDGLKYRDCQNELKKKPKTQLNVVYKKPTLKLKI